RVTAVAGQVTAARFAAQASAAAPVAAATAPTAAPTATLSEPATPTETTPAAPPPTTETGPTLNVEGSRSPTPLYVGGTVVLVGATTAVVFALFKQNAQDSADSVEGQIRSHGGVDGTCSQTDNDTVATFGRACTALRDNLDKVDQDALIANIG